MEPAFRPGPPLFFPSSFCWFSFVFPCRKFSGFRSRLTAFVTAPRSLNSPPEEGLVSRCLFGVNAMLRVSRAFSLFRRVSRDLLPLAYPLSPFFSFVSIIRSTVFPSPRRLPRRSLIESLILLPVLQSDSSAFLCPRTFLFSKVERFPGTNVLS